MSRVVCESEVIYENESIILTKVGENSYHLTVSHETLGKVFLKHINNGFLGTITSRASGTRGRFLINNCRILSLDDYLKETGINYQNAVDMLCDINELIVALEETEQCIPFFNTKDIIVIIGENCRPRFVYLNNEKVYNFDYNNVAIMNKIHEKSPFLSTELEDFNEIPYLFHSKSGLFSLACLISYCLFSKRINVSNKEVVLSVIHNTKLYWALLRMLETEPDDRYCLII